MSVNATTVRDLRRHWKPHKERLALQQPDHPTAVRFHRACSWLDQSQKMDAAEYGDLILMQQWTALNALYGRWNAEDREPVPDRRSFREFFGRVLAHDKSQHIETVLYKQRLLVFSIVENAYLYGHFWRDPTEQSHPQSAKARYKIQTLYHEKRWLLIADELLDRIYLLRCQLVHGAATFGSKLNREALTHCTQMLGHLLPAVLRVWIDHGSDLDWGPLCYPPQDTSVNPLPAQPLR